ncbi:MAG: hypothetical protein IT372_19270, partial [Polyangiaceae bacterium]|nr:hypothetical protein [Polyangiaceae bacterium]
MRPRHVPTSRASGIALLAAMLWMLLTAAAQAQPAFQPKTFEVPISLEAELVDPADGRALAAMRLALRCYEWQAPEATRHFVIVGVSGEAELRRGNKKTRVALGGQVTRREGKGGLLEVLGDGSRRWRLAADLSIGAPGEEPAALELDVTVIVPPEGKRRGRAVDPGAAPAPRDEEIAALRARGDGGEITARGALWGRPAGAAPVAGVARIEEISTIAPRASAAGREADRIIARLQYVAGDYRNVVKDGAVVNQEEFGEQVALLADTIALAESANVPQELHDGLFAVRQRVEAKAPPPEVAGAVRAAIPGLA